jgi:hypothetical protein
MAEVFFELLQTNLRPCASADEALVPAMAREAGPKPEAAEGTIQGSGDG